MNYTIVIVLTNITDFNFTVGSDSINWTQTQALTPYVGISQDFSIDHREYYNQTFDFSVSTAGEWKLQFLLFTEGQPVSQDSYREVHLWLIVS